MYLRKGWLKKSKYRQNFDFLESTTRLQANFRTTKKNFHNLLVLVCNVVMSLSKSLEKACISKTYSTPGIKSPTKSLTGPVPLLFKLMFFVLTWAEFDDSHQRTMYISTRPSGRGHSRVTLFESTSGAMFVTGFGPGGNRENLIEMRIWFSVQELGKTCVN